MEPIRVLHIVTSLNMGGIENFIMTNYRNIDRTRIQFDFLKHRDSHDYFDDEVLSLGGKIYSVPPINPLKQKQYDSDVRQFFKEYKQEYSIVHSHINTFSAYPLKIAKEEGVGVRIAHAHATTTRLDVKTPFRIYTKKVLNNFITDAFACSNDAGKWLFGDLPFTMIPNAINSEKYLFQDSIREDVRNELGIAKKFVIGVVAGLTPIKNHRFLVEIFPDILKRLPDAQLVFVGEGGARTGIERLVKALELNDRVLFTGLRNDINRVLQGFDVFALPSFSEGFPISLLEAETVGIPCIASSGVPTDVKLFDDMNTTFISIKDKNMWIEKIVSLYDAEKRCWANEVSHTQYDVKNNVNFLMEFYEQKYNSQKNKSVL